MNSKWISLACLLAAALPNPGQPQSSTGPDNNIRFEVVSIHQSGKDSGYGWSMGSNPFLIARIRPSTLIKMAYLPMYLWSPDRVRNCPADVCSQPYDIQAKVPQELLPKLQGPDYEAIREQLFQELLANRFQLKSHITTTESTGFALVVAKQGSKLKPTPKDQVMRTDITPLRHGGIVVASNGVESFSGASIASLIDVLASGAHTIVEDRTGLTGRYNFELVRQPDFQAPPSSEVTRPELIWKLHQLGLRVEPIKVKINTVVIDHIEAPSPN